MSANMLLWNIWRKPIRRVHSWWIPSVVYPWCLLIHCHLARGCFQTCQKNKMASIFAFRSYSIFTHANKNKSLLFKEGARSIINFLRGPSVWHVRHDLCFTGGATWKTQGDWLGDFSPLAGPAVAESGQEHPREPGVPADHSLPLPKQLALDCCSMTEQIFDQSVNELALWRATTWWCPETSLPLSFVISSLSKFLDLAVFSGI